MLTTLTTITTLGLAQLPQELPLPVALEGARVEVVLQATSNHFAARNTSEDPQVLLFGNGDSTRSVRLEPGARVLYPFPRGTADAFQVEVVSLDDGGWRNTGAVALSDVRGAVGSTLWVQAGDDRSVMWIDEGVEGLAHVSPADQLVPGSWLASHPELETYTTHVPVPMPDEGKKSKKPPVIEKKKLPPV